MKINRNGIETFKVIKRQNSGKNVPHGEIKVYEDGLITYTNNELYSRISDLFGEESVEFVQGNELKEVKIGSGIISTSRKIYKCEKDT